MNDNAVALSSVGLTDKEFGMFRDLVFNVSGISLNNGKKELVRTRLGAKIRKGGFKSYMDYYDFVANDRSENEIRSLLDAISTNLTSFYREIGHFDFLKSTVIPYIVENKRASGARDVRVWSAGCSSGEEPYTLAFTLMDQLETIETWNVKVLASDISNQMLETAQRGVYREDRVKNVPKNLLRKYFQKGVNEHQGTYRVRREARQLITFKRFNLMTAQYPFKRKFDFIFCRNVMIYFDMVTQETLVNKFYDSLESGGYLLIGHSESLTGVNHNFKYVQPTIYRKP